MFREGGKEVVGETDACLKHLFLRIFHGVDKLRDGRIAHPEVWDPQEELYDVGVFNYLAVLGENLE